MPTRSIFSAIAVTLLITGAALPAYAQGERGGGHGGGGNSSSAVHGPGPNTHFDTRHQHNQYYPTRGYAAHELPHGAYSVPYHGGHYWYHGGAWYAPYGPRWVVVAPPFGVYVPFLPPFYTTVWFGGVPYYYANDAYYMWRDPEHGYEVVEPPGASGPTT